MKTLSALCFGALLLIVMPGCAIKQKAKLERGVEYVKASLSKIGRDPAATLAFQGNMESGANVVTYLYAGLAEPSAFPPFEMDKPSHPWTVVIKEGSNPSEFLIEGYGADLAKPLISTTATMTLPAPKVPEKKTEQTPAEKSKEPETAEEKGKDPPLTVAAAKGQVDVVKSLLAKGADVNAMSAEGATALMYASVKGYTEIVKMLLAARADVKLETNNPQRWTALMYGVHGGVPEIVQLLLDSGSDANVKDFRDDTPLMLAAMRGYAPIVQILLKAGAQTDCREKKSGNTALLLALGKGHREAATTVMKGGANVNVADDMGLTPLMLASALGQLDIARELVKRGANVNAKMTAGDGPGSTALMHAAAKGQADIIRFLIESGADIGLKDQRGADALRYAEHNRHENIADMLRSAKTATRPAAVPARQPAGAKEPPKPQLAAGALDDLIGRTAQDADAVLGAPKGRMVRGGKTVIFYSNAEVEIENGKITGVNRR